MTLTAAAMEQHIRDYFDACNSGEPERIAAYFEPDGVHYFPPGMYGEATAICALPSSTAATSLGMWSGL